MQYKTVPAPKEIVITGDDFSAAVRAYGDLINKEAVDGWRLHSIETLPVTSKPGCLAGLIGKRSETITFNMLVFEKE